MHLLAEAAAQEYTWVSDILRGLGPTGAVTAIIGYTLRKFFVWVTPLVEQVAKAHIERQHSTQKCMEELTTGLLEAQKKHAETLAAIEQAIPKACKFVALVLLTCAACHI